MESDKGKSGDMILFAPKGQKDLRDYHPELRNYPEFRNLKGVILRFVWNYCMLYTDDRQRLDKSLASSGLKLKDVDYERYKKDDFPGDVKAAIVKMNSFDPGPRLIARKITERTFISFQKIIEFDVENLKDENNEVDWSKASQYVNTAQKINESMPELIKQLEAGFGMTSKKEVDNESYISDYYKSK